MAGQVKLRLGDLFDGTADVIVLPSSSQGTITPFVAKRLLEHAILTPSLQLGLGEVSIVPFRGAENIAQYVAYAASVDNLISNRSAILRIGQQLGKFTRETPAARTISAPLLGAGAGGLQSEVVVEALAEGFRECAVDGAVLTIHVLHRSVYDRLVGNTEALASKPALRSHKAIRAFISYSGTSDRHRSWVGELGTFLRHNGIDARLDQWHLRNGMDLPQWMGNELQMADRIIVISDSRYAERADGRMGGVGWETMLIQGEMSNLPPESTKYLVIVRENSFSSGVPRYLKTKFSMHWPSDADDARLRDDLLKELYKVDPTPPLGSPPTHYLS
jgi:SEFIR domain